MPYRLRSGTTATLLVCAFLLAYSVIRPEATTAQPSNSGQRIRYGYDGQFGRFGIADTAEVSSGSQLLAKAKAMRIIEKTPGPNHILVEEEHYAPNGGVTYRGTLEFRFGAGGGTLVEEKAISGKRRLSVFGSWPAGR